MVLVHISDCSCRILAKDMGFLLLPSLLLPSRMPDSVSQRVYLAFILSEFQDDKPVPLSRRGGQKLFNRGSGRLVSKDLKELSRGGWLLARRVEGSEAFAYSPGVRLTKNEKLFDEWREFSESLFGRTGLVKRFVNSSVWGHGLLGFSQTLVLGTLVYRRQAFRRVDVRNYLAGLVGVSTIDTAIKTLLDAKVLTKEGKRFERHPKWKANLQVLLHSHIAGTARRHKIAKRVALERQSYGRLIRDGKLTSRERKNLLREPCVRCGARAEQVEHFPPRKFGGEDHIHMVWAICKHCNTQTKGFIQRLKHMELPTSRLLIVKPGVDVNDLLRASLAKSLAKFYVAAKQKDYDKGHRIITNSLVLIDTIKRAELLQSHRQHKNSRRPGQRNNKGTNPVVRERSRPKYRD